MDNEYFNQLENKIYSTRKSRIAASERYKEWDSFFTIMNAYYSLFVLILSILNLSKPNTNRLPLSLLIISVIAFSFTLFISSLNYKEKALCFKNNYIALDKLYSELMYLKSNPTDTTATLFDIDTKYKNLLDSTENHDEIDYFHSIYNDKERYAKESDEKRENINKKIKTYKRLKNIKKVLYIIAPILLPLAINLIDYYITFLM